MVVIVDLGNVHDVLQQIGPYVKAGCVNKVWAYADRQFNGYGINPPHDVPNCTVWRAFNPHTNAADNMIVWDVASTCTHPGAQPCHFIVVTKDQGFHSIKELAEETGMHKLDFANSWEELRNLIE